MDIFAESIACLLSVYHVCKLICKSAPFLPFYLLSRPPFLFLTLLLSYEMLKLVTKWKLAACKNVFHTDRTVGISLWWFCFYAKLKHVVVVCWSGLVGRQCFWNALKCVCSAVVVSLYCQPVSFCVRFKTSNIYAYSLTSSTQINACIDTDMSRF